MNAFSKDLIVLVEGKDDEKTIAGLVKRAPALGIRPITVDIFPHPNSGPGCVNEASNFLRNFTKTHHHALVFFDREGCGRQTTPAITIENEVKIELIRSGWNDRAGVIVVEPELEAWVWSLSPHVEEVLGWKDRNPNLREWLITEGWCLSGQIKPEFPKEAMQAALRVAGKARSSAIYGQLAEKVSLQRCQDESLERLKILLQTWFAV